MNVTTHIIVTEDETGAIEHRFEMIRTAGALLIKPLESVNLNTGEWCLPLSGTRLVEYLNNVSGDLA